MEDSLDDISDEMSEAATINAPNLKKKPRGPMKKRLKWWDYFEEYYVDKRRRARCKLCKKDYCCDSGKNGTYVLKKHMNICKVYEPNIEREKQQEIIQSQKGKNKDGQTTSVLSNWKFDQEVIRKATAFMIIVNELPFKFVESRGYRHMMSVACPKFRVPSRHTITRDCFQLYLDEKESLKKYLKSSCTRVCLTTDTWTSVQRINYMVVTAHWIDNEWNLNKRVLNFVPISSHKGDDFGLAVERCLSEWGLDKIMCVTVDYASSNDTALSYLRKKFNFKGTNILEGKLLHLRCCAHIINLIVCDGLTEHVKSISRIRACVKFIRQSPARIKKFKECVKEEGIDSNKALLLDVPTRWNSCYMMLEVAAQYEKAFDLYAFMDPVFKHELSGSKYGLVDCNDWDCARKLVQFLKIFYDMTLRVSRSLYVTCNNFYIEILDLDFALKTSLGSEDLEIRRIARKMKEKFDKYWGFKEVFEEEKMNPLIFISVILDPRHKWEFLTFTLDELYGKENGSRLGARVKKTLYDLFEEYKKILAPPHPTQRRVPNESVVSPSQIESQVSQGGTSGRTRTCAYKSKYYQQMGQSGSVDSSSELDKYLNEAAEKESDSFEILNWWKVNSPRFPILSHMARNVMSIPVFAVSSEAAFSTGGRVLDEFRSSLTTKMVQALICTQDWLRPHSYPINIDDDLLNLTELEELENELPTARSDTMKRESGSGSGSGSGSASAMALEWQM